MSEPDVHQLLCTSFSRIFFFSKRKFKMQQKRNASVSLLDSNFDFPNFFSHYCWFLLGRHLDLTFVAFFPIPRHSPSPSFLNEHQRGDTHEKAKKNNKEEGEKRRLMWCVETDHGAVVGPRAELHGALLVVEGKPRDVDLARALEDARRDVAAAAVVAHHHVRLVRVVERLVRAATINQQQQQHHQHHQHQQHQHQQLGRITADNQRQPHRRM